MKDITDDKINYPAPPCSKDNRKVDGILRNGWTIYFGMTGRNRSEYANALKKNDLYRFITRNTQPSHNTFNTLRRRLGPTGFIEIHKRFVKKAHALGLLDPEIRDLPKNRKKGIIIVADSTFMITAGSTRGKKDDQGQWHFNYPTVSFLGKRHHKHKYPVGHKAHSLRIISGVPLVTLISPANQSDQDFIVALVEELFARYPCLRVAYIILDRGYDAEEKHHDIYEFFDIIPVIIRKKMVYPNGFTAEGYPSGLNTNKEEQNLLTLGCAQNPFSLYCSNAIISKSTTSMVILVELILLMDTENMDLHYLIV